MRNAPNPARPLFAMNAEFLIADSATASDLLADVSGLLEPIRATVSAAADALSDEGRQYNPAETAKMLYGALHLLDMVDGMNTAAMALQRPASG